MTSTARIVTETKNNRQNTELNYTKKKCTCMQVNI